MKTTDCSSVGLGDLENSLAPSSGSRKEAQLISTKQLLTYRVPANSRSSLPLVSAHSGAHHEDQRADEEKNLEPCPLAGSSTHTWRLAMWVLPSPHRPMSTRVSCCGPSGTRERGEVSSLPGSLPSCRPICSHFCIHQSQAEARSGNASAGILALAGGRLLLHS